MAFALFLFYLMFLAYMLFLSPAFGRNAAVVREYNLIPLKTIKNYIQYREYVNSQTLFINIFGNILAFVPMGFFIPIIFRNKRHLMEVFFFSSIISLGVEFLQYRFVVGSFDVDDILLNTAGGILGYILFLMIYRSYRKIRNKNRSKK
ncbi:MAG: VanZ family protein [Vallitaleaceae bacterium]|nr:VanZ family protein [Vallitaleaceae bacterium]